MVTFLVYHYLGPLVLLWSFLKSLGSAGQHFQRQFGQKENKEKMEVQSLKIQIAEMSCSRPPAWSGVWGTVDPWCGELWTSDLCPAEWTGRQWLRCRAEARQLASSGSVSAVSTQRCPPPHTPPPPLDTAPPHQAKCHSAR